MTEQGLLFAYTETEQAILSLLQKGRRNAQSVKFLAGQTGLSETEVREKIRHLIMVHDVLIASTVQKPAGFYIPETPEEIDQATRSLRHRGISILARAAKLQRLSLEDIYHQAKMEFDAIK